MGFFQVIFKIYLYNLCLFCTLLFVWLVFLSFFCFFLSSFVISLMPFLNCLGFFSVSELLLLHSRLLKLKVDSPDTDFDSAAFHLTVSGLTFIVLRRFSRLIFVDLIWIPLRNISEETHLC